MGMALNQGEIPTETILASSDRPDSNHFEDERVDHDYSTVLKNCCENDACLNEEDLTQSESHFHVVAGGSRPVINLLNLHDSVTKECAIADSHMEHTYTILKQDSTHFFTGGRKKVIRKWNSESGVCEEVFKGHNDTIADMILMDDNLLISAQSGGDKKIRLWDVQPSIALSSHEGEFPHNTVSPIHVLQDEVTIEYPMGEELLDRTGSHTFGCISTNSVFLYDLHQLRMFHIYKCSKKPLNSFKYYKEKRLCFVGGEDQSVLIFDERNRSSVGLIRGRGGCRSLLLRGGGNSGMNQVVFTERRGVVGLYDLRKGETVGRWKSKGELWINRIKEYDEESFVTSSNDGSIQLWKWDDMWNCGKGQNCKSNVLLQERREQFNGLEVMGNERELMKVKAEKEFKEERKEYIFADESSRFSMNKKGIPRLLIKISNSPFVVIFKTLICV